MRSSDPHRPKRLARIARFTVTAGLLAGCVILGWALLWPETGCNEPACARKRFVLAVEVDVFRQVTPIEFEVPIGSRSVSLRSILASGGVETTVMPDQARPDGFRRPVPRPHRPRGHHARGRARAPDLGDGRPDHGRLGDADEQGLRGDRGPPPVRLPLRPHRRRRPPAVDRPRAGPAQRRRLAGAPRPPGHADPDLLRASPSRARRRRRSALDLAVGRRAELRGARPRALRLPAPRPRGRQSPGGTAPCVLNAADEVAVEAFLAGRIPFAAIAEVVARRAGGAARGRARATSRTSSRSTPRPARVAAGLVDSAAHLEAGPGTMSTALAIALAIGGIMAARRLPRAGPLLRRPARAGCGSRSSTSSSASRSGRSSAARPSTGSARSRSGATPRSPG